MNIAESVPAASNNNPLDLIARLHGSTSPKIRRAMTGYAVGLASFQAAKRARKWWQDRYAYTVSVSSSDDIYDDVHEMLLGMIPEKDRRAVLAAGVRNRDDGMLISSPYDEVDSSSSRNRLVTFYDGDTSQTLTLEGHKVVVAVEKEAINLDEAKSGHDVFYRRERLKFRVHSEAGRQAVLRWLAEIVESRNETDAPRFFIMSRYGGGWNRRRDLEPRSLDTVILRAGQIEALVEDVTTFLRWHDDYMHYGIPYHRGYLLSGPPGTGKTSLARALAAHFGLDVYYAPLSDLDKDTNLLHLVSQVKAGSVLLLEDIDILHASKSRDDDAPGVSLSGLLNSLDGVSTPSGIITIMTTNHLEVLDDALVRPGRVDRLEAIGYMDDDQLGRLVRMLVGEPTELPSCDGLALSPAEVLEVMKRHLHEPKLGLNDVRLLIEAKRDA